MIDDMQEAEAKLRSSLEDLLSCFTNEQAQQFADAFTKAFSPKVGDCVLPHEVTGVHSTDIAEDGKTMIRLYDVTGGRTGMQCWPVGEEPSGPVRYAD